MNDRTENPQSGSESTAARDRCVCGEFFDHVRDCLGVSPEVKKHLANSRIEFLKAIRSVIDERIERLSAKGQQGTKIAVE